MGGTKFLIGFVLLGIFPAMPAFSQTVALAIHLQLVLLCLLKRSVGLGKVSAGILHFRIEEETVKIIANVVMKLDEILVLLLSAEKTRLPPSLR